ncbi:MAG: heme-binding protein [Yoonia sp.]|nr:heme-binding protein [Yoonia sp.]
MASRITKTIATGFGLIGSDAVAEDRYKGYESPPYVVEQTIGEAEVRAYTPSLIAEVTVRGSADRARGRGFQELAGFIFGGNTVAASIDMTSPVAQRPSEKIAMTSPVTQSGDGELWTVSFTMPRTYTRDTLPVPNSDAIRIVETAPQRQIVLGFSGLARSADMDAKAAELRSIAQDAGFRLGDGPFHYFYDGPMTLPWKRRNEVAYVLD